MSPEMEFGVVMRRIASATSVIRTRVEEEARLASHGVASDELSDRVRASVNVLKAVANQLEQAIA